MTQTRVIVASLIGGFILFLAVNQRLGEYLGFFLGTRAPASQPAVVPSQQAPVSFPPVPAAQNYPFTPPFVPPRST